ncbi:MAG TPA: DUF1566 domain-containing protein [Spirochaetes bacterium]|nr:DUF1566 domain-containing protein [Spirochaetota bacterium]
MKYFSIKFFYSKVIFYFLLITFTLITLIFAGTHYRVTNEIVYDETTKLTWTRCSLLAGGSADMSAACSGVKGELTWEEAVDACNHLNYSGRKDWRLPNIKELKSIVVYNVDGTYPCINKMCFPNTKTSHYWSSTTHPYVNDNHTAFTLDYLAGNITYHMKTSRWYVRCVAGP